MHLKKLNSWNQTPLLTRIFHSFGLGRRVVPLKGRGRNSGASGRPSYEANDQKYPTNKKSGGQDFLYGNNPNDSNSTGVLRDFDERTDFHRGVHSKKKGGKRSVSLPRLRNRFAIALVLIQHLHGHSCLVGVCVTTPSLKDRSIGEVLPHLGPPQKHLSELVSCRQSEFA